MTWKTINLNHFQSNVTIFWPSSDLWGYFSISFPVKYFFNCELRCNLTFINPKVKNTHFAVTILLIEPIYKQVIILWCYVFITLNTFTTKINILWGTQKTDPIKTVFIFDPTHFNIAWGSYHKLRYLEIQIISHY